MMACHECGDIFRRHSKLYEHLEWHAEFRRQMDDVNDMPAADGLSVRAILLKGTHPMTSTTTTEPEALAAEPDMSWFDIAVTHRREVVILGHSDGWSAYEIEHWWEDAFDTAAPKHLEPGAYRWTDFTIGYWGESDHINCTGGKFTALSAPAARMLAGEGVTIPSHHAFEGDHSSLRLRFDTALAGMATINGDSGWIVHTNGHADDMERAIEVINELRAKLARPPALDKEEGR